MSWLFILRLLQNSSCSANQERERGQGKEGKGSGSEVSPRFLSQRQSVTSDLTGNECAHGAVFKVSKPKKI